MSASTSTVSTNGSTVVDPLALDRLDTDLTLASISLGVARARFDHCGSATNARLLDEAVSDVDRLLDERLARRTA
jgi:hypothetical protein